MSETRTFDICDVIGAATGYLLRENGMGEIYKVLSFVSGEDVYTHQIQRVSREFGAHLKRVRPDLATVFEEAGCITQENWRDFVCDLTARFGDTIAIGKMTEDEHERIDPASELVEKIHPSRIITIAPTPTKAGGADE